MLWGWGRRKPPSQQPPHPTQHPKHCWAHNLLSVEAQISDFCLLPQHPSTSPRCCPDPQTADPQEASFCPFGGWMHIRDPTVLIVSPRQPYWGGGRNQEKRNLAAVSLTEPTPARRNHFLGHPYRKFMKPPVNSMERSSSAKIQVSSSVQEPALCLQQKVSSSQLSSTGINLHLKEWKGNKFTLIQSCKTLLSLWRRNTLRLESYDTFAGRI